MSKLRLGFGGWAVALPLSLMISHSAAADPAPELLPNNQAITPAAARGAHFSTLNPGVSANPSYVVGQAVTTAISPDGKTLLVLTSGYNLMADATGNTIPELSTEFVFVFDIAHGGAVQKQVIPVPNTFIGLTFSPDGHSFYVTGGKDDNVHTYRLGAGNWAESGTPVDLGHGGAGNGLFVNVPGFGSAVNAQSAGVGVTSDGAKLVVANFENDSISIVDVASNTKTGELDLRPGKIDPAQAGVPGGEFPFGVAVKGKSTAYVSSIRDREVVVVDISGAPHVVTRIQTQGNPNKMILNRAQSRLLVATDNADLVYVIDTRRNEVVDAIKTTAPAGLVPHRTLPTGSSPNSLALSPDERTLYVTNSGSNSVAVIDLDAGDRDHDGDGHGRVLGLIPTGWFPNAVSVSRDGKMLYVVNGKSNAGPNPGNCTGTSASNTLRTRLPRIAPERIEQRLRLAAHQGRLPDAAGAGRARARAADRHRRRQQRLHPLGDRRRGRDDGGAARPHQARDLHRQGEPHLRPDPRRHQGAATATRTSRSSRSRSRPTSTRSRSGS